VAEGRRKGAIRAALGHRDFRFLVAGQLVSQTGDWLYSVALIVYVLQQTHSAAWVAATSIVRFLPFVFLSPIGGAIADRYDRRRVMILMDLLRAATMVVLAVGAAMDASALFAILVSAVAVVFSAPYFPCVYAATPALVGEEDLTAGNAIVSAIANITLALGPAVGGVLLALGSPALAFGVNAATFAVSGALTYPIRTRLSTAVQDETEEHQPSMVRQLLDGIRAVTSSADVLLIVIVWCAFTMFFGQEIVLYTLVSVQRLGLGEAGIGYLFAATGVGGVLATAFSGRMSDQSRQGVILALSAIVAAVPMFALAFITSPALAYALLLLEGAGFMAGDVVATTTLQRILPADVLGRVLGILDSLMVAGILVGSVVAPVVVNLGGLQVALGVAAGLLAVAGIAVLPRARELDRRTAARVQALQGKVEFLEHLRLFEAASRQALEALAGVATEETVPPGTVVIRQGDEPDDLFGVMRGRLEVTVAEDAGAPSRVATMKERDYFGEIGLLRRIPRTATVTAVEECELLRISGEDFVRIANEGPGVSGTLRAGMARRLARTPASETGDEM
jgi:MFS family permease